jgi:hypothetical protein
MIELSEVLYSSLKSYLVLDASEFYFCTKGSSIEGLISLHCFMDLSNSYLELSVINTITEPSQANLKFLI